MKLANIIAVFAMFVVFVNGACEKKSSPPAPPTQAAPNKKPPGPPTAADPAKDDPASPSWLPDPEEVLGWVRTSNIEVIRPGEITGRRNKLRGNVEGFSFKSMFYFKYESTLPEPGGVIAAVSLVELSRRDAAYGLATCMMPIQARDSLVGSMSSVENDDGWTTVHGWQGRYYIHATMERGAVPEPRVSLEKLAAALLRPIPSAEPPGLLSYLTMAHRIP
ncbi:MAG: hypothetical protein IH895_06730, partial [Planctomycetes bacterium]|nr:hypothetical protein [Planctomycetota bacterium]